MARGDKNPLSKGRDKTAYKTMLYQPPFSSLHTVFDTISSDIDKILSGSISSTLSAFGNFKTHPKDCYSSKNNRTNDFN